MPFDITTFIAAEKAMLQLQLGDDWNAAKPIAEKFLAEKEAALQQLAADFAAGEFDQAFLTERIKDEAVILQSELAALSDIGKVMAENAANGFVSVFLQTLLNLIPIVLP